MNTNTSFFRGGSFLCMFLFLFSCSIQRQIGKTAKTNFINDSSLNQAHVGISIFDPLSNKFLYNYQSEKYFVPASNTKIFSCYAGMKYLGNNIAGIEYFEDDTAIYLLPTADPTLLHKDYHTHPVIDFLKRIPKSVHVTNQFWKSEALANGWAWNDYNESYMVERSALPVYGNVIRWIQERTADENKDPTAFDQSLSIYSLPEVNWKVRFNTDSLAKSFFVQRGRNENTYLITEGTENKKEVQVPFVTNGLQSAVELLKDTIFKEIIIDEVSRVQGRAAEKKYTSVFSQPTDSVLRPMMHRSDNFFAEQVLLMASYHKLGMMDDDSMIRHLLKTDLSDLPDLPRWVDGSGLSRYNLFTPRSFVRILTKMTNEFPIERIHAIFPTAGEGTLDSYPKTDSGLIYAKTGTLSGVVALSGFLYTRKNRLLVFSILVNNHRTSATAVRRSMQKFLFFIRNTY